MKTEYSMLQVGRSMIEMLGVLAIIGVLSLGGLAGYRIAMNRHQANNILSDTEMRAMAISEQFQQYQPDDTIVLNEFIDPADYTVTQKVISSDAFEIQLSGDAISSGVCKTLLGIDPYTPLDIQVDGVSYTGENKEICETNARPVMTFVYAWDLGPLAHVPDDTEPEPDLPVCSDGASCTSGVCDCQGYCIDVVS